MERGDMVGKLIHLYSYLNEAARHAGRDPIFKPTSKISLATHEIAIPEDKTGFENLIRALYILFYESSGYGKRLRLDLDKEKIIQKTKELRNHYVHDREHGRAADIRKKFERIGDIYEFLSGKRVPSSKQDWTKAGNTLIQKYIEFSNEILEDLANGRKPEKKRRRAEERIFEEFFEHEITVFPHQKEKFRKINTYGDFSSGGTCALFLPTFSFSPPPEFGDTHSAVYLTSEAPQADFEGFKKFIREIERKWSTEDNREFTPSSGLMPWSISSGSAMIYGSGSENLIEALRGCSQRVRACVSVMLQGIYGEDSTCTFFILIGSDLRGGRFQYNFIDFYLSTIPIEWNWIKSINDSLDKLSSFNMKATSYALKSYLYNVWEGLDNIPINKDITGGIGRSGNKHSKRDWDTFDGLILNRKKLDVGYVLDKSSSWESPYYKADCPKKLFDEFTVSVTNHPPDVDEIQTGKLIGIYRPRIYMLGFPGKGWDIFAINVWGGAHFE